MCWNPYELAKDMNSADEYCGPLSLLMISGMPCRAKMDFKADMVLLDVVDVILTTSG